MKKFNRRTFLIWTFVFIILLFPSFFAAFAEDEGTLVANIILIILAKLFHILRFPTHTILWTINGWVPYLSGLLLNCFFYGLVIERLIFILKKLRQYIRRKEKTKESFL
jgi:hypothetical protein